NEQCSPQQRTTRISGRDGLCVDVYGALTADGSRVILYPCGQQQNQQWTFYPDNTIRSLGKCLATSALSSGSNVVITNCDYLRYDDGWMVSSSGTMMNKSSHLVLTANAATSRTNLTGENNVFAAKQAWRIGNYVEPIVTTIIGLRHMCLEATDNDTNVWLESCVKNKTKQYWALYSDDTIRVNNNRNLCVSSSTDSSSKLIVIRRCDGSINQRWVFTPQGTISNPGYEAVMDVAQNDVYLKKIVLSSATDKGNGQQWTVFY
nr:Chain B, rRNA N-glycosidase [Momordica charantia]4Z9W_B Chain B, rRNA N-glycosidase [Momordica charantia]4ZBV_B Chain B, rRNA N-glycosidase [Momordica charantia]4ZFU_B Chain B, rRNA N-glycosidase [Momordica charantia]4ZFW_B Chain B, rRNA N-glycosidase [Momordica charantia]4ZFY_B Chain B, rRNA N-glycosidase [Momordica charantia]4ZGR_B Chain B, rRNA N-glycosidase [Momordica charantia]4ZLB_B Chain B, rRNA N-glycosidase [Momordica charantia]